MEVMAHRTRAVCGPSESQRIIDALVAAGTVRDTRWFSDGGLRVAEFVSQHAAGNGFAPLHPAPDTDTYGRRLPDPFTAIGSSQVCDMWKLDYGDRVHGHVAVSPDHTGSCFPLLDFRIATRCGTTSRHWLTPPNPSVQAVVEVDSPDGPTWRTDTDLLADYLAGNRHDVGALDTVVASVLSSAATFRTQSGPPLNDRVWKRDLPAPGTDLAFDMTGDGGLHAVYRVYPKKRTNQ